jgi:hypothetical protein
VTHTVLETGTSMPSREASFRRRFRLYLVDSSGAGPAQQSMTTSSNAAGPAGECSNGDASPATSEQVIARIVEAAGVLGKAHYSEQLLVDKMLAEVNNALTAQLIGMINAASSHVVESNLIDNSKLIYARSRQAQHGTHAIENNPKFCKFGHMQITLELHFVTVCWYSNLSISSIFSLIMLFASFSSH